MEQVKTNDNNTDRWLVATQEEFIEAEKNGLYKKALSLPAKEKFDLCPIHIYGLIKIVSQKIEEIVTDWHKLGEEAFLNEEFLESLERLLYMLEDLYPHYFNKYKTDGKIDYKKWQDDFVLCWILITPLKLIRHLVAFPHNVEELYQAYDKDDQAYYANLPICGICGAKDSRRSIVEFTNIRVHEECAINKKWHACKVCRWLYPNNDHKCQRTKKCQDKELVPAIQAFYG